MLKHYIQEALEPTLLFSFLCCLLGIIAASFFTKISLTIAVLLIVGIFFAHISTNVLDDYVDYKRGIDTETTKTKFSGGSSLIVNKSITPNGALVLGMVPFFIALGIGIYLITLVPAVLPIVVIGALTILLYAGYLVNVPYFAEPLTTLNFMLITIGAFVVATGSGAHVLSAFIVAFPAGSVVGMALLINEVPDRKVDKKHGRRSGVVMLDSNSKTAYYYIGWQLLAYLVVIYGVASKLVPYTELIFLIVSPLMLWCFTAIKKYTNAKKFEKYMGINAIYGLAIEFLLVLGFILAMI